MHIKKARGYIRNESPRLVPLRSARERVLSARHKFLSGHTRDNRSSVHTRQSEQDVAHVAGCLDRRKDVSTRCVRIQC